MYSSTQPRVFFSCSFFLSGTGKTFLEAVLFLICGKKRRQEKMKYLKVSHLTEYITPSYKYATISTLQILCRKKQMTVKFSSC